MNGDERDALIKLKATFEERWKNHDKRSEEIWKEMQGNIKGIFSKLSILPCKIHEEKFKGHDKQIAWIWRLLIVLLIVFIGALSRS